MHDILKIIRKNFFLSFIFKLLGLGLSILIVGLATDQNELLLQQILLFQVSIGYFSIFDMGVPSHLKSQAYNGCSNNSAVWLVWLVVLSMIFVVLTYVVSTTVFENAETFVVTAAVFGSVFTKFSIGYFQSKYKFIASYGVQIWIPALLVIYLLFFDALNFVSFNNFIIVLCAVSIVVFILVTRPDFLGMSATWYQDMRGGLAFLGAQVLTVLVFGLHEYLFIFFGQSFLGWSIESRYYLFISALGPVISNLFWAYLSRVTAKESIRLLFLSITSLVVWGGLVFLFRDAFFDLFWPKYKNLITDTETVYVWIFYISHTVVLFVSGYLYAARKSLTVLWALCVLLVVRIATLKSDIFFVEPFSIYEANCILGIVASLIFIGVCAHQIINRLD